MQRLGRPTPAEAVRAAAVRAEESERAAAEADWAAGPEVAPAVEWGVEPAAERAAVPTAEPSTSRRR